MIYLDYMFSELRRRRGRTFLTAFGLALGVGLVITVNALSTGLDDAQAKVLKPLTGVGTDMSVTRPITISTSTASNSGGGPGGFPQLSAKERAQLEKENGNARVGFGNLGKPGTKFSRDSFMATSQLSFPAAKVTTIGALSGVSSAAGGLTLSATHVSGTVPKRTATQQQGGPPGSNGGGGGFNGPHSINFSSINVSGVDQTFEDLGAITAGQISSGRYFTSGTAREAILNVSYANRQNLKVGDTVKLAGNKFTVVGLAKTPLGGASSDVYVKLTQLQKMSGRTGRVNTVYVRAASSEKVGALARHITAAFPGSSVTTAKDLADRVSGSLVSARNLTSKLGFVLEIVGLLGAIGIAALLTLSSVTKRTRELGTLKAIGWPRRLVVRQVTGESLLQGVLGGIMGIALGLIGAAAVSALVPPLKASFAQAQQTGFPGPPGGFGQGAVADTASSTVSLAAHVSPSLIVLAVLLAVAGGLISGAAGALRAARLRPAVALRHID